MRKAIRVVASLFGVFAGFGGPEHGYFEVLQGNIKPDSLIIAAIGAPCDPEKVWNLCEPAMTILPSFLFTGVLAIILGILTMIWAAAFVHKKSGGVVLILLSVALLLFGGGLFPPLIGIVAGVVALRINTPLTRRRHSNAWCILAKTWPWPLVAFFVWAFGQFVIGYFYNELLQEGGALIPGLILSLLVISILAGHGRDLQMNEGVMA